MAGWLRIYGLLLALWPVFSHGAGRHIDIIVDTSGSMLQSDPRRYTVQLSQIIADLTGPEDSLSVIRLPQAEHSCAEAPDASLVNTMEHGYRSSFQARLDKLLVYGGGNAFAAPIHTAQADLEKYVGKDRLLLFIADSGGLDRCAPSLTEELLRLKAASVMIAAINIGGPGAFGKNPAFSFTTGAMNAEELTQAVAEIYQHFLGGKHVQTGRVQDGISFTIASVTRFAFLVIAADGAMSGVEPVDGNPTAAHVDLNYLGGGQTVGLDKRQRDYRIVRLQKPEAGVWRFKIPGLTDPAGWMLVQDSALNLRLLATTNVAQGMATPLEAEFYDQDSGQRVNAPGLDASLSVEGQGVHFHDDGQDGDLQASDGILTAMVTLNQLGKQRLAVHLESDTLNRRTELDVQVDQIGWLLQPELPPRAALDKPLNLAVRAKPNTHMAAPVPMHSVVVETPAGEERARLHDDGKNGDAQAGDGVYSGHYTPDKTGEWRLHFHAEGGSPAQAVSATLNVRGEIQLPPPQTLALGRTGSHSQLDSQLDLSAAQVKGEFTLEISSDYAAAGSALSIDLGAGWVPLDAEAKPLKLSQTGPRTWPLRLITGDCPEGINAKQSFTLKLTGLDAENHLLNYAAPLSLEILADPWLHCWWPVLAVLAGALIAGILFHGYYSPARFPPRLGVVISPEEDLTEGFFHPIRAQRGTGSGFYRDASVYIRQDYRLSGKPKAALARLRAHGTRVFLKPMAGIQLYRQNLDGDWDAVPQQETYTYYGVVYKDAMGGVYFALRNG